MGLTSDALRPRSDAGRGRRSGVEEDAARPGSTHGNRLRRAAATRGMKKTQPGPESTQRNGLRGSCYEMGGTNRPADQPQDGPVRDAARPGSYVGNVLGSCAREAASQLAMADRRVVKLRPVPQEPCRRREGPASVQGALRPGCPRGRSERRSNRCECVLRGEPSGERGSILPVRSPGRLFGEQGSILCSRSRIRGTGILQVSRHETLEKPETASIIARTSDRMEGFGRGNRPPETRLLAPT